MTVTKNDGSKEELNLQKFRNSLQWATDGIKGVSVSDIEMQCKLHMYDGIPTSYILDVSIKATYDMSSIRYFGYDEVSRNLMLQKLYKQVFKSIEPHSLACHLAIHAKSYPDKIHAYSIEDLDKLNKAIDHSRDFTFSASGLEKTINSDIKHANKIPIETPQLMFMLMAMDTFHGNIEKVIEVYNALSLFEITLPTPVLKALRTTSTDYASCCTVRVPDNVDGWAEGDKAVLMQTVASAGVGVDIADNASIGDMVKNGTIKHSGKIPIIKSIDAQIAKASQNGRRGSATCFVNFYDPEIEDIFALKSPRTSVDKRINDMSYGIKLHQLVYDRAKRNENISLFSIRDAPHLNSLMYGKDPLLFIAEYERLESIGAYTSQMTARNFLEMFATEKAETSVYYPVNIDEVNSNTPYLDEISQSNICVEFMTPTKGLQSYEPDIPAIGICVLGNVNQTKVSIEQLPRIAKLLLELQTMLALRQNHPMPQANAFVSFYRDVGLGTSNHANWLAINGWRYGQQEALDAFDEWMEAYAYALIDASCDLVDVFGVAPGFSKTNWSRMMPIDRYNKNVDTICTRKPSLDWASLQKRVSIRGMANCGLMMIPPSESSSIGSNQTSSLEPIREPLTIKDRQGVNLKQYAPDPVKLIDKYDYAYDRDINADFIKHVAVAQKWVDKGISSNVFYNPDNYPDKKVRISDIIKDMFYAKFLGLKTGYYHNTKVPEGEELKKAECANGGCSL